jgi:hypothetical protein
MTGSLSKNAAIQAAMMSTLMGKAFGSQPDQKEFRGNKMLKLENFFDKELHKTAFDQTKDIRAAVYAAQRMVAKRYGTTWTPLQLVWRWKDAWTIPVCNRGTEHPIAVISAVTYSDKLSITALKTAERMETAPRPRVKSAGEIYLEFVEYMEMAEEQKQKRRSR